MTVLVVCIAKDEEMEVYQINVIRRKQEWKVEQNGEKITIEKIGEKKWKNPVVVAVTGTGIIRKVYHCNQADDMERITGNETFMWNRTEQENGDWVVDFTRKDWVASLLEAFETDRIPVVDVYVGCRVDRNILSSGEEDIRDVSMWAVERFYKERGGWKELTGSGQPGDVIAGLIAGRMKIPLLVCLLGLLLINYLWIGSIGKKYRQQQEVLILLEKDISVREKSSDEMRLIINEFGEIGTLSFSSLSDRIASQIPTGVSLETMVLNPLLKSIEEKKPLVIRKNHIGLTGSTTESEKVAALTGSLAECDFARQIKLISLDRDRETGMFHFSIWIDL